MSQLAATISKSNLLDMETSEKTPELSDSLTTINMSGILNKSITGIETMMDRTIPTSKQMNPEHYIIESKAKRMKAALIILAKARPELIFWGGLHENDAVSITWTITLILIYSVQVWCLERSFERLPNLSQGIHLSE